MNEEEQLVKDMIIAGGLISAEDFETLAQSGVREAIDVYTASQELERPQFAQDFMAEKRKHFYMRMSVMDGFVKAPAKTMPALNAYIALMRAQIKSAAIVDTLENLTASDYIEKVPDGEEISPN